MSRSISPHTALRLLVGFALLPGWCGVLTFLIAAGLWAADAWIFEGQGSIAAAVSLGLAVGLLATAATVFCALPTVAWLLMRGPVRRRDVLASGLVIGNLPFVVIVAVIVLAHLGRDSSVAALGQFWYGWRGVARAVLLGCLLGGTSAALLWTVGFRRSEVAR